MRPTNILILLLCSINLISCSNKIGIGVHSVESGKSIFIPSEGYRERLINSSTEDCYFFTIQKVVDDALIRKRDCIGTIMSEKSSPAFNDIYKSAKSLAVSLKGKKIAYYFKSQVFLYDSYENKREIIFSGIDEKTYLPVHYMNFISDEELVVVAKLKKNIKSDLYSIIIIDFYKKKSKIIYDQIRPALPHLGTYAVAKKERLIAFFQASENTSLFGDILFLNIDTHKISNTISNTSESFIGYFAWSPNEQYFAYIRDTDIVLYSLPNNSNNTIKKISNTKTNFNLIFLANNKILFKKNKAGSTYSLMSIDISSGDIEHLFSSQINGKVILIDNRKKIIYENGY